MLKGHLITKLAIWQAWVIIQYSIRKNWKTIFVCFEIINIILFLGCFKAYKYCLKSRYRFSR